MENRVKDDILTGTITNKETGEAHDIDPSYWFPNGCELNAIAKPDFDSKSGFTQKNINDIKESVWGIVKV